ncbi:hypothetical protein L8106_25805 [Lyngbya sp. PCC 8106]|nr:hypothetical protein L8106_25805 [Lyngbya sp. PCC 8106]
MVKIRMNSVIIRTPIIQRLRGESGVIEVVDDIMIF